jgi:hypothetical protein
MPKPFLPCHLYCLEFPNGKKYIGLTIRTSRRRASYRAASKAGSLLPVHKAIRKYGFPGLRILCIGSRDYIADLEVRTIAAFRTRTSEYGYNVFIVGDLGPAQTQEVGARISPTNKERGKGLKRPPEFGAAISAAKKGVKRPPEAVAKMRAAKLGRPSWNKGKLFSPEARANMRAAAKLRPPVSEETRARMSATRKGRPRSEETRAKISAAHLKLPPFSAEHRANMSAANRKRKGLPKRPFTAEHRANIGAARKGLSLSPEHRASIRAGSKGHAVSPETRAKISAAHKGHPKGISPASPA